MAAGKKASQKRLATGRPPTVKKAKSITRKATRTLINAHHTLEKKRAQAVRAGDDAKASEISAEIASLGGLGEYQQASLQGQRSDRGGDTSKVLLDWLRQPDLPTQLPRQQRIRMLEVGALSSRNACSVSGLFDMVRIDLNSQEPAIQQQDYMQRPLPADDSERFDIVSLSLVLNFVPTPAGRGEMLRRTTNFLRSSMQLPAAASRNFFPAVFIVLPRPCLHNSRYFSEGKLVELMRLLGFTRTESKTTQKLAYSLWQLEQVSLRQDHSLPKREINPGPKRNNFAVILEPS